MRQLLFILAVLVWALHTEAQTSNPILGKWKIVAVDDGVYYNYKTDSMAITKKLQDSLVGKKDSAITVEMLSMFVYQYEDYYFSFDDSFHYQETRSGMIRVSGSYTIDTGTHTVEVLYGSGENRKPHRFKYKCLRDELILSMSSAFGDEFELTLERVK
ncbi:MAG: hypothetical protein JST81_01225 [Bacteroidetes bacterium]|nr:hypothetical protein [Bacteroidota bacterium]